MIGAGAASITTAKQFIKKPFLILLIESGDFEFNREAQDLYKGDVEGNLPGSNDNLYIAGSSVFPRAGFANTTLTIFALALRLADYIEGVLNHE
ncbi:MAG: hypothetical protein GVY20_06600 [Bacteroidetes bacterium]|nr:hypothetical protein [Bacteroidota bacterium]